MTTTCPVFLSVKEVAQVLKVSQNTAYDYVRSGQLPSIRVGRQIRIPAGALDSLASVRSI